MKIFTRWYKDESGQVLTEYGLVIAVIALIVVAALVTFREELSHVFTKAGNCVKSGGDGRSC